MDNESSMTTEQQQQIPIQQQQTPILQQPYHIRIEENSANSIRHSISLWR